MKRSYKRERCAPTRGTRRNPNSCYSDAALSQLKTEWNTAHAAQPVVSNDPTRIWGELKEKHKECDRESCWSKNKEVKQATFAPTMPSSWKKNINEWLSSDEISKILKQYERVYPEFVFLGPSPTDYFVKTRNRCVWEDLCKFNLKSYINRGKTKIGVVFNLDPHDKPGSHWVALFINTEQRAIYFFDSTGDKIHRHINRFRKSVQAQAWTALRQRYTFDQNSPVEHQHGDTECGMYVLFFIITMLQHDGKGEDAAALGPALKKILKGGGRGVFAAVFKNYSNKFPDKLMENLRKKYFNEA